jgi:hypothetical protein
VNVLDVVGGKRVAEATVDQTPSGFAFKEKTFTRLQCPFEICFFEEGSVGKIPMPVLVKPKDSQDTQDSQAA